MSWKVVITARSFGRGVNEAFDLLEKAGCDAQKVSTERPLTSGELAALVSDADALIVGNDVVDAEVIERGRALKVISRYGVGIDNIDVAAASRRGICITNTPGTNDHSVADLAMGMMIALARSLPKVHGYTQAGEWRRLLGYEVYGKTLGVIGTGRIGAEVIRRAQGFEMKVLCHDVVQRAELVSKYGVEYLPLDDVLKAADFVTIHVPLVPLTRKLIGRRELGLMKRTAYLINLARGGIVDEQALFEALRDGVIAGAGIDVFEAEPPAGSPLLRLDNVIVTSHIGGHTQEAIARMSIMAATNVVSVLRGGAGSCPHVVNRLELEAGGQANQAGDARETRKAREARDGCDASEGGNSFEQKCGAGSDKGHRHSGHCPRHVG